MERITIRHLQPMVDRLNKMTHSPAQPYVRSADGTRSVAQIGNYHLSQAYGGFSLHRMFNNAGGVSDVFRCGYVPARELYHRLSAYIDGMDDGRRMDAQEAKS